MEREFTFGDDSNKHLSSTTLPDPELALETEIFDKQSVDEPSYEQDWFQDLYAKALAEAEAGIEKEEQEEIYYQLQPRAILDVEVEEPHNDNTTGGATDAEDSKPSTTVSSKKFTKISSLTMNTLVMQEDDNKKLALLQAQKNIVEDRFDRRMFFRNLKDTTLNGGGMPNVSELTFDFTDGSGNGIRHESSRALNQSFKVSSKALNTSQKNLNNLEANILDMLEQQPWPNKVSLLDKTGTLPVLLSGRTFTTSHSDELDGDARSGKSQASARTTKTNNTSSMSQSQSLRSAQTPSHILSMNARTSQTPSHILLDSNSVTRSSAGGASKPSLIEQWPPSDNDTSTNKSSFNVQAHPNDKNSFNSDHKAYDGESPVNEAYFVNWPHKSATDSSTEDPSSKEESIKPPPILKGSRPPFLRNNTPLRHEKFGAPPSMPNKIPKLNSKSSVESNSSNQSKISHYSPQIPQESVSSHQSSQYPTNKEYSVASNSESKTNSHSSSSHPDEDEAGERSFQEDPSARSSDDGKPKIPIDPNGAENLRQFLSTTEKPSSTNLTYSLASHDGTNTLERMSIAMSVASTTLDGLGISLDEKSLKQYSLIDSNGVQNAEEHIEKLRDSLDEKSSSEKIISDTPRPNELLVQAKKVSFKDELTPKQKLKSLFEEIIQEQLSQNNNNFDPAKRDSRGLAQLDLYRAIRDANIQMAMEAEKAIAENSQLNEAENSVHNDQDPRTITQPNSSSQSQLKPAPEAILKHRSNSTNIYYQSDTSSDSDDEKENDRKVVQSKKRNTGGKKDEKFNKHSKDSVNVKELTSPTVEAVNLESKESSQTQTEEISNEKIDNIDDENKREEENDLGATDENSSGKVDRYAEVYKCRLASMSDITATSGITIRDFLKDYNANEHQIDPPSKADDDDLEESDNSGGGDSPKDENDSSSRGKTLKKSNISQEEIVENDDQKFRETPSEMYDEQNDVTQHAVIDSEKTQKEDLNESSISFKSTKSLESVSRSVHSEDSSITEVFNQDEEEKSLARSAAASYSGKDKEANKQPEKNQIADKEEGMKETNDHEADQEDPNLDLRKLISRFNASKSDPSINTSHSGETRSEEEFSQDLSDRDNSEEKQSSKPKDFNYYNVPWEHLQGEARLLAYENQRKEMIERSKRPLQSKRPNEGKQHKLKTIKDVEDEDVEHEEILDDDDSEPDSFDEDLTDDPDSRLSLPSTTKEAKNVSMLTCFPFANNKKNTVEVKHSIPEDIPKVITKERSVRSISKKANSIRIDSNDIHDTTSDKVSTELEKYTSEDEESCNSSVSTFDNTDQRRQLDISNEQFMSEKISIAIPKGDEDSSSEISKVKTSMCKKIMVVFAILAMASVGVCVGVLVPRSQPNELNQEGRENNASQTVNLTIAPSFSPTAEIGFPVSNITNDTTLPHFKNSSDFHPSSMPTILPSMIPTMLQTSRTSMVASLNSNNSEAINQTINLTIQPSASPTHDLILNTSLGNFTTSPTFFPSSMNLSASLVLNNTSTFENETSSPTAQSPFLFNLSEFIQTPQSTPVLPPSSTNINILFNQSSINPASASNQTGTGVGLIPNPQVPSSNISNAENPVLIRPPPPPTFTQSLNNASNTEILSQTGTGFVPIPPTTSNTTKQNETGMGFIPQPPPPAPPQFTPPQVNSSNTENETGSSSEFIPPPPPQFNSSNTENESGSSSEFIPPPPPPQNSFSQPIFNSTSTESETGSSSEFIPLPPPPPPQNPFSQSIFNSSNTENETGTGSEFIPPPPPPQNPFSQSIFNSSNTENETGSGSEFIPPPPPPPPQNPFSQSIFNSSNTENETGSGSEFIPPPPPPPPQNSFSQPIFNSTSTESETGSSSEFIPPPPPPPPQNPFSQSLFNSTSTESETGSSSEFIPPPPPPPPQNAFSQSLFNSTSTESETGSSSEFIPPPPPPPPQNPFSQSIFNSSNTENESGSSSEFIPPPPPPPPQNPFSQSIFNSSNTENESGSGSEFIPPPPPPPPQNPFSQSLFNSSNTENESGSGLGFIPPPPPPTLSNIQNELENSFGFTPPPPPASSAQSESETGSSLGFVPTRPTIPTIPQSTPNFGRPSDNQPGSSPPPPPPVNFETLSNPGLTDTSSSSFPASLFRSVNNTSSIPNRQRGPSPIVSDVKTTSTPSNTPLLRGNIRHRQRTHKLS